MPDLTPTASASTGPASLGLLLAVFGVLVVAISSFLQFYYLDYGSSNQITIEKEIGTNIICVLTGISFFAVGFILWIMFSDMSNKYLAVFMLAFSSYLLSNMAILFSLYQVNVVST
jgi:hypothetical protein